MTVLNYTTYVFYFKSNPWTQSNVINLYLPYLSAMVDRVNNTFSANVKFALKKGCGFPHGAILGLYFETVSLVDMSVSEHQSDFYELIVPLIY